MPTYEERLRGESALSKLSYVFKCAYCSFEKENATSKEIMEHFASAHPEMTGRVDPTT